MFIMNFKEIHSNAEFLSTYRRARRFPLQGKCHEVTKGLAESQICSCRNKIKNTFIEKWLEHSVQATFGTFRLLRVGSTHVQLHSQKTKFISLSRSLTLLIFNLGGN